MNYELHYTKLIDRARGRKLDGYTEIHHVVPRCMDGTNDLDNLVKLTPEEHYVAHQLLVKMYPLNKKLAHAAFMMTQNTKRTKRNNKLFGWIKRQHSIAVSETMKGNKHNLGKTYTRSEETVARIKESLKNSDYVKPPLTEETKLKIAASISAGWSKRKTVNKLGRKSIADGGVSSGKEWDELSYKQQRNLYNKNSNRVPAGWLPKTKRGTI